MYMVLVGLLTAALTAVATVFVMNRRLRTRRTQLERQLHEVRERMQRSGNALAAAQMFPFEIDVGGKRVRAALGVGAEKLAAVDYFGNRADFMRRVHPDDVARLEGELATFFLLDGVRQFDYRYYIDGDRECTLRAVTQLIRDELSRPIMVCGVLFDLTSPALPDSRVTIAPDPQADDTERVKMPTDSEWTPFTHDDAASSALEGEFTAASSPRIYAAG